MPETTAQPTVYESIVNQALEESQIAQAEARPQRKMMSGEQWRNSVQHLIDQYNDFEWDKKIHHGDGKPCLFLPFVGEFGHQWMYHVRRVHFSTATEKIVCCQRGQEVMYPTATQFFYDWTNPVPDSERQGTDRRERFWPDIQAKFPGRTFVQGGCLSFEQEWRCIEPTQRIPFKPKLRGLKADVCIGTRARGFIQDKNWLHCQRVADAVMARGFTVATIGHPSNSYHLNGEVCMSGYYDIDAGIELIQNCKLFFAQDCGACHLASTVGCDMAVLDVPDHILGRPGFTVRTFFDRMKLVNQDHKMLRIDRELWDNPDAVIDQVLSCLPQQQNQAA